MEMGLTVAGHNALFGQTEKAEFNVWLVVHGAAINLLNDFKIQ
ncbi:MAG: hypothetical protein AB1432_08045 [Bacteroidota bacterium]